MCHKIRICGAINSMQRLASSILNSYLTYDKQIAKKYDFANFFLNGKPFLQTSLLVKFQSLAQ